MDTSAGSATSMRVRGATTVTRLNTVVPVATSAPFGFPRRSRHPDDQHQLW